MEKKKFVMSAVETDSGRSLGPLILLLADDYKQAIQLARKEFVKIVDAPPKDVVITAYDYDADVLDLLSADFGSEVVDLTEPAVGSRAAAAPRPGRGARAVRQGQAAPKAERIGSRKYRAAELYFGVIEATDANTGKAALLVALVPKQFYDRFGRPCGQMTFDRVDTGDAYDAGIAGAAAKYDLFALRGTVYSAYEQLLAVGFEYSAAFEDQVRRSMML